MIRTYIKLVQNHNCAHAYMLAADDAVLIFFRNLGFLKDLDFSLKSFYDGTTVCLIFKSKKLRLTNLFSQFITKYKLTIHDFEKSTQRAAIQLSKNLKTNQATLKNVIRQINNTKWVSSDELFIQKISAPTKDNAIKLSGRNRQNYEEVGIMVGIKNCPDELRGLAVVVIDRYIEALWQIACDKIGTMVGIDGDWKKQEPMIGSIIVWRNHAGEHNNAAIHNIIISMKDELTKRNFHTKVVKTILRNLSSPEKIFNEEDLAWYSGVIMGKKGWKKIATENNVQKLLDIMTVETVTL